MKKLILLAIPSVIVMLFGCSSSKKLSFKMKSNYQILSDSKSSKPIISGAIEWEEWKDNALWNLPAMESKSADILISKSVCSVVNNGNYFILIYAGSWCEDSESQLPIIFKVFEKGGMKSSKYQLLGVDRDKNGYGLEKLAISAQKVPTLVILYDGKEIGRIEELPQKSWEQDILSIIYKN